MDQRQSRYGPQMKWVQSGSLTNPYHTTLHPHTHSPPGPNSISGLLHTHSICAPSPLRPYCAPYSLRTHSVPAPSATPYALRIRSVRKVTWYKCCSVIRSHRLYVSQPRFAVLSASIQTDLYLTLLQQSLIVS